MLLPGCLLLVAATSAPPPGSAADVVGVLAVAPRPGPGPELSRLVGRLREALADRPEARVLDAEELRLRMAGRPTGPVLDELDRGFQAARQTALDGDEEGSVRALRHLAARLERLPGGGEALRQWTRAMLRLAKTELDLGRAAAAGELVERVLRADPEVKIEPRLYPKSFAARVDEARKRLASLPRHGLTIESEGQAHAFVSGRHVGTTPVTVTLPAGRYQVSGLLGPVQAPRREVDLESGDRTVALDFGIPDLLRPSRGPGLALPRSDDLASLLRVGAYLWVDLLVAASIEERDGPYLQAAAYDLRTGAAGRSARVRLVEQALPEGGAEALAAYLATGEAGSPLLDLAGASGPAPVRLPEDKVAVHYHRPDGRYEGWSLYAWESFQRPSDPSSSRPIRGFSWWDPLPAAGRDGFGVFWLLDSAEFGNGWVNFVVHAGERKDHCGQDLRWHVADSREVWLNAGECRHHLSREAAERARR
jgi:hypothetical protein